MIDTLHEDVKKGLQTQFINYCQFITDVVLSCNDKRSFTNFIIQYFSIFFLYLES